MGIPHRQQSLPILLCHGTKGALGRLSLRKPDPEGDVMGPGVEPSSFPAIQRTQLRTLQVNLGYRCNQACSHCHVGAGPWREEEMDAHTISLIPRVLSTCGLGTLDLTGGAPELHPQFRTLVEEAGSMGVEVIDRCNLTILLESGQEDLATFLAAQRVTVIASLPCYQKETVDRQRGSGVFSRSVEALRKLNQLGYGRQDSGLLLHLVYNPSGPTLPPDQKLLETAYKEALQSEQGIVFNELKVLTNMPIARFADQLEKQGLLDTYQTHLRSNHSPANLERVMCRTLLSVDWRGHLYDCDFNQMLDRPAPLGVHLSELLKGVPAAAPIHVGDHCFGCTAGHGSSCGGALTQTSATP